MTASYEKNREFAGLDGCRKGWVVVVISEAGFARAWLSRDFATAMDLLGGATSIAVDMPLGSASTGTRRADQAARDFLKGKAPSVFNAPPRAAMKATDFQHAQRLASGVRSKGFSQQSFAILPEMIEVDAFVGDERLNEVHPEVSFRILDRGEKLARKKSWRGAASRLRLLRSAGIELPEGLAELEKAEADDALDAAVAAWSARRIARGESRSFPESPGQKDRSGRLIHDQRVNIMRQTTIERGART